MRRRSPPVLATFALVFVSCSGDRSPPRTLMDGAPAEKPSVELEGVSAPAVLTRVEVIDADLGSTDSTVASCVGAHGLTDSPRRLVRRVSVTGSSLTFATSAGLYGCDDSLGPSESERRWCGTSFGAFVGGKLEDPRLDLAGCVTESEAAMGFLWVEPHPDAQYVAVEQEGYTEVYEAAGGLPVRIAATTGVEIEGSRITLDLSEHDVAGALVRRYELQAAAAG